MQEIFKDIPGYEGLYQISTFGIVKSLSRKYSISERVLKQCVSNSGYYVVTLLKNHKSGVKQVHQLVAITFLNHTACKFKLVVDHIDHNKLNNNLPNLRITTHRENTNRKHLISTSKYTGVYWHKVKKKWNSQININNRTKYLGYFTDELKASEAYQLALSKIEQKNL